MWLTNIYTIKVINSAAVTYYDVLPNELVAL